MRSLVLLVDFLDNKTTPPRRRKLNKVHRQEVYNTRMKFRRPPQVLSDGRFFLTAGPERNSGGTGSLHPLPPPAVEPLAYPRRSRLQRQKNVGAPPGAPTPTNNYCTLCNVPLFHSLSCPFAATYHVTMSAPHGAAITVEASSAEPSADIYLNCPPEGTLMPNLS